MTMIIKRVLLEDFNLLKEADIYRIEAHFTSRIAIIIGTNGCGKSAFLSQLIPAPQSRSLYGDTTGNKSGRRILDFEVDGTDYSLSTDYKKPSSPHEFFIGDSSTPNVNEGGTTDEQQVLIETHLGIDDITESLIAHRINLAKAKASERKDFIMRANPADLRFVFEKHRKIQSSIRGCKAIISRLMLKKMTLEQELMSDEILTDMRVEKEQLEKDLGLFQGYLSTIEVHLNGRSPSDHPLNMTQTIDAYRQKTKRLRRDLRDLSDVERDDSVRSDILDRLTSRNITLQERHRGFMEQYTKLQDELRDLELRYEEIGPDSDLSQIEENIKNLEIHRDKATVEKPPVEVSSTDLDELENDIFQLKSLLSVFTNMEHRLCSRRKRYKREASLNRYQNRLASADGIIADTESRLVALERRHSISPRDIPVDNCAKNRCPLYSHFFAEYSEAEEQREKLRRKLRKMYYKKGRLEWASQALATYLNNTKPHMENLSRIVDMARTNPVLHHVLKGIDVLYTVQYNTSIITNRMMALYTHIRKWNQFREIISDLDSAYTLRNARIGSQNVDSVKIVMDIKKIKDTLSELSSSNESISAEIRGLSVKIWNIRQYNSVKDEIADLVKCCTQSVEMVADRYDLDQLTSLKASIGEERSKLLIRLGEIERVLRDQTSIRARYDEEIVKELATVEKEKAEQERIEKVLVSIPRRSTADFMNKVIDAANIVIGYIWTVPLELEHIDPSKDISYEILVKGDYDTVRDISKCSDGQTEIINLALNIGLRMVLGKTGIPLCLDEAGRTFDTKHKQNLVLLLRKLLDDGIVSQLFLVNHHASIHEGFADSETIVLKEGNMVLPEKYNLNVDIK
jgi:ABC-type hemin transport system ATPase subunit